MDSLPVYRFAMDNLAWSRCWDITMALVSTIVRSRSLWGCGLFQQMMCFFFLELSDSNIGWMQMLLDDTYHADRTCEPCAIDESARALRTDSQHLLSQPSRRTKTYGDRAFASCASKFGTASQWDIVKYIPPSKLCLILIYLSAVSHFVWLFRGVSLYFVSLGVYIFVICL